MNNIVGKPHTSYAKDSALFAKLAFGTSILALILAGLSAVFALLDWQGDKQWQSEQIGVLQDISKKLDS